MRLNVALRLGTVAVTAVTLGLVWSGCSAEKTTELVPGVTSQIQVPRNLKTVRVDVTAQGSQGTCIIRSVDPTTGGVTLPRTLGILPEGDKGRAVTVTVTGYAAAEDTQEVLRDCLTPVASQGKYDANVKILRRSRQKYVDGKILFIPMPLRYSCWGAEACPDDQTCKAGVCVPAAIDEALLPEYRDDLVQGNTSTCFSPRVCLADKMPAKLIDADKCKYTFPIATTAGTGANVRVYYDGAEAETLDLDAEEGFFLPDPQNPKVIQLAPGLCTMVKNAANNVTGKRRIEGVEMASICPPKTMVQPICDAELNQGPLPDGGNSTDGGCNVQLPLVPAPSALYVLLDQSNSMRGFFGTAGLKSVLDFSLSDPTFRTTYVAFKLLSHDPGECSTPDGTATGVGDAFDVPFQLAPAAQPLIAAIVGDASKVRATDDKLFVDAVLRPNAAYHALRDRKEAVFNRRAVMLIANRPFKNDCAPLRDAAGEAAAALGSDKINTYVVALENPADKTYSITEADLIAASGGTKQAFDVRSDPKVGALAFNTVLQDLASCLYERPAGIDPGAVVSFVNPLTQQPVELRLDSACSEATQTSANGWNVDNGRVRLCGQACTDLRSAIAANWQIAAQQNRNPTEVVVRAMQVCK